MSIKWLVYYCHRLKWYLFVELHRTSVLYWCTLNWSAGESRIAKVSVQSVTGKTLSYELKNAILSIASTQFCILTVTAFVDLKKDKNACFWNNGTYEGKEVTKNRQQESRNSLEWSTDKDSISHTFFYSVAPFHIPTTPPTLWVLSRADLAEHVRSDQSTAHSSMAAG